jgi:hypothetical protein
MPELEVEMAVIIWEGVRKGEISCGDKNPID